MGLGSGENGEFTFLDSIGIVSFIIGCMNLEENMTQGDKQELEEQFNNKLDFALNEIHSHLQSQDKKIDQILQRLEGK